MLIVEGNNNETDENNIAGKNTSNENTHEDDNPMPSPTSKQIRRENFKQMRKEARDQT